jgi:cytochrome c5
VESKLRKPAVIRATPAVLAGLLLAAVAPQLRAENTASSQAKPARQPEVRWTKVNVQLPTSLAVFPAGRGADIANSQCLMCHSADMVLHQPTRTQEQWKDTINKMRTAYGAPLPAEQVDALAAYLSGLNPPAKAGS